MSMNDITERKVSPGFHNRIIAALFLFLSSSFIHISAEETDFPGVYRYRLENGLELYVAENSAAPLASVHYAAKTGAVYHTPENAGLFHLYEHMLFKGNAKYANQAECMQATNEMGAINDNAYTSVDIVNYYFTIPSSQIRKGLEFWSYAVRTPKFDQKELENEIKVVLSEINGNLSSPGYIRSSGFLKCLYPSSPYKLDPGGNPEIVKNATAEQMRRIQNEYYVPENSALFVGGDVRHEEVYKIVKEIFGDWKKSEKGVPPVVTPTKVPFKSTQKLIFVNPGASDNIMQAGYYLRGPDGETDAADTYAADVWSSMVQNPKGILSLTLIKNEKLGIPDADYTSGSYSTKRASGLIGISVAMMNGGLLNPVEKCVEFESTINNQLIPAMKDKGRLFSSSSIQSVIQQLEDRRIYELETASAVLSGLTFFWSSCNSDYFFEYDKNIAKVTEDEVVSFVEKYIENKAGAIVVTVSPGIWNKYQADFIKNGYRQITAENAFWFQEGNVK